MFEAAVFCLAMTIFYEARAEPIEGQVAVADVVMNRARWKQSRVCTEVFKPKQFSSFNKPQPVPYEFNSAWKASQIIARRVIKGGRKSDTTYGANHFYNPSIVRPYWAGVCEPRVWIAQHYFCYIGVSK